MNVAQIKDEIRKPDRIEKIGLCKWLDEETVDDLVVRVGMDRARGIRQGIRAEVQRHQPGKASSMARARRGIRCGKRP
jgi:hypothetical protein